MPLSVFGLANVVFGFDWPLAKIAAIQIIAKEKIARAEMNSIFIKHLDDTFFD